MDTVKAIDIFYLCDGMACSESKSCEIDGLCEHTNDINHAINKDALDGRMFEYIYVSDDRIGFFEKEV